MSISNYKKIISVLILFSCFMASSFSQDFPGEDDFDSIFEDAAEDIIVEEDTLPIPQQKPMENLSSAINFSGKLEADVGAACIYTDKWSPAGYLDFDNIFNIKVRPSNTLALNSSIKTNNENRFTLFLSDMYIDYLVFDRIYISAGLKSSETVGGYTRILSEAATKDTSGWTNIDVRFPWSTGMIKFLGAYNQNNTSIQPSSKDITLGGEIEQTIGHTNFNLFGKKYGENILENGIHKHPSAGLEIKRTILGFDTYVQTTAAIADYKQLTQESGYERVAVTTGFYRLWDSWDPNVGINIEYKFIWTPEKEIKQSNEIAYEFGLKRMGKKKNLKLGVEGKHNIDTTTGNTKVAFLVGDVFPYANWVNAVSFNYQKESKTQPAFASIISIDLDY